MHQPDTPRIGPADEDNSDREIALLFAQIHAAHNAFWRQFRSVEPTDQVARQHELTPVDTNVEAGSILSGNGVVDHGEAITENQEPTGDESSMVREFLSPAQTLFRVREDDWIEATTHGFTDVRLCDHHGQRMESNADQPNLKTTLRVSSGQKYVQSLVFATPLEIETKRLGRGR